MREELDHKMIGNRIREARKEVGYNQTELADFLGISQTAIAKMEQGEIALISEHLYAIANALNRPVSYFLNLDVGGLAPDEVELLQLYRSMSPGPPQENALKIMRVLAE